MEEGLLNHFKQSEAFIRSKIDIVDGDDHNGDGFENNELFLGLENASLKKMINQLKTYEHRLIGLRDRLKQTEAKMRTQATIALNEKNAMIEKTDPQACAEISRIFKDQRSILDELAVTRSEINKIKENQRRELINMLIRGMADTEKSNSDTSISLNEILKLINNFSDFVIIDIENFTASKGKANDEITALLLGFAYAQERLFVARNEKNIKNTPLDEFERFAWAMWENLKILQHMVIYLSERGDRNVKKSINNSMSSRNFLNWKRRLMNLDEIKQFRSALKKMK